MLHGEIVTQAFQPVPLAVTGWKGLCLRHLSLSRLDRLRRPSPFARLQGVQIVGAAAMPHLATVPRVQVRW